MIAAYPLITPRCSSRRTRWCTADVERPVSLPRSVYDIRPFPASSRRTCRSSSSTPVTRSPVQHRELARPQVAPLTAGLRHDHDVLDPRAVLPGEVDAGLDRE